MDAGTRANALGMVVNLALAVSKLVVGTLAGSHALVADGLNSAGDVVATGIAWVGWRASQQPPDANHPGGHGKYDAVAGLTIGAILLATGVLISVEGVRALAAGDVHTPGMAAAWVAGITALVKEGLYRYVYRIGAELRSAAILASARDHRADVLTALTVLCGVLAARLGLPWLDPLAAAAIGVVIVWLALEPLAESWRILTDEVDPEAVHTVRAAALADPDVRAVREVRLHPKGPYMLADLEIDVDRTLTVAAAHAIAHRVQDRVVAALDGLEAATVHVNPAE